MIQTINENNVFLKYFKCFLQFGVKQRRFDVFQGLNPEDSPSLLELTKISGAP